MRQHATDDSLLAMLTSNRLQEAATPRSRDPLSATAARLHSLSAKPGGLEWCASAPPTPLSQGCDMSGGLSPHEGASKALLNARCRCWSAHS